MNENEKRIQVMIKQDEIRALLKKCGHTAFIASKHDPGREWVTIHAPIDTIIDAFVKLIDSFVVGEKPELNAVSRVEIIRNAISLLRERKALSRLPIWSLVANLCGRGSTGGTLICKELGINPDASALSCSLPEREV